MNRRNFLQFLGVSGVAMTFSGPLLSEVTKRPSKSFPGLPAIKKDAVVLADGLTQEILIKWGDAINFDQRFGFNNDFISIHSLSTDRAILWVNHEYVNSMFINGPDRSKKNIDQERLEVGGSLLEIKKQGDKWKVVPNSLYNRRLDGSTEIPLAWPAEIANQKTAIGTLANCAGGKTPWGTFLSCEENYDMFYGEKLRDGTFLPSYQGWEKVYPLPPEHYGWVVEIEPLTGKSKKLISLGRCAHECAAINKSKDGKVIAYTGDDANNEHLYKFISHSSDSLESGKLYVANLEQGRWLSLDINDQPILKKNFKDQTEVQVHAREAAKLVGATPLDRPEDIEFDPLTGHVFIALTNNKGKKNYYGSILKIMEDDGDYGSLTFTHDTFATGGTSSGFACPDNMVFDPKGNLWFTSDISGSEMNKGVYQSFGNNSLFVFLRSGSRAGEVIRVASAPNDAEFTGPCFSPDYKTLFLSVQHPGEQSENLNKLTSYWPDGGIPRSAVITIQGKLLDDIVKGRL